ncbi:MAG: tetratricopeptide repeat protein [Clostridia bacterium]|nr:tetratricopeptide repeat protein [Clostridia bacterium]
MKIIKTVLLKGLIPITIILIDFNYNFYIGMLAFFLYIGFLLYTGRAGLFTMVAQRKYSKRDMNGAVVWLKKAYDSGKAKPKTIISYAYLLLKIGRTGEADKVLSELLEKDLKDDDKMLIKSNMALVLWKKGKLDEAIAMLEELHRQVKNTTIYGSLGCLLILKGNLDRALKFNLEAYAYNSSNNIIMDNLGNTYYLREEYDKAQEIYQKLMEANPAFPEAYYNYGLVLLRRNESQKALDSFKKALKYQVSFLNTVTSEEIQQRIKELEA